MAVSNFTEALMGLRRKAQLSGRPLSQQETAGVVEGYANTASERLARSKSLSLQEEGMKSTERMNAAALEEQRQSRLAQMQAADKAEKSQKMATLGTTAAVGGLAAAATTTAGATALGLTNPITAPVAIGLTALAFFGGGGTWLCTETKKQVGMTDDEWESIGRFRQYAKDNHPAWLEFYVRIGPKIVERIEEIHGEKTSGFYIFIKENMIKPVIVLTDSCHLEEAIDKYKECVLKFIDEYAPEYAPEARIVDRIDRIKEAA